MRQEWNSRYSPEYRLYPSATINNDTFKGTVNPDNVFEAICATFESMPSGCQKELIAQGMEGIVYRRLRTGGITMNMQALRSLVIVLLVLAGVFFCWFRKRLHNQLGDEQRMHVNSAVYQYKVLSEYDREVQN